MTFEQRCALAAILALLTGCATEDLVPDRPKSANLDLAPFTSREDCAELAPGDRLDYFFESNEPVKFAISYRDSNMVIAPITRDDVREDSGVFAPQLKSRYCLTWQANEAGALVAYHATVRKAPR